MKKIWGLPLVFCQLVVAAASAGTNYYVRTPETCTNTFDQAPFTSWATAATNIPWVIALARDGDVITVSNGTYALSATITNLYALTIQSADIAAPENTVLDGLGANRNGVIVSNAGAVVRGFTVKSFGMDNLAYGVRLYVGQLTDCVITGCFEGVLIGGANTVLSNCTVTASSDAGIRISTNTLVVDSRIIGNFNRGLHISGGDGACISNCMISGNRDGGIRVGAGVTLKAYIRGCDIIANHCRTAGGGGVQIYDTNAVTVVDRCSIISNTAFSHGAGISFAANTNNVIRNSLIAYNVLTNTAGRGGGIGWNGCSALIENCTVVSNRTLSPDAGGICGWGGSSGRIVNTVVYDNRNSSGTLNWGRVDITNCSNANICTTPSIPNGVNIITNEPAFVDRDAGNYRLRADSLCVNAGTNFLEWMNGAQDLDGHLRIDRFSGMVDIGAFEYVPGGAMFAIR